MDRKATFLGVESRRITRQRFLATAFGIAATTVIAAKSLDSLLGVLDSIAKGEIEATPEMREALKYLQSAPLERVVTDIRVQGIAHSGGKFDEPDFFSKPTPFGSSKISRLDVGSQIDRGIVVLGVDPAFPVDSRKTARYVATFNPKKPEQIGFVLAKYLQGARIDTVTPYILGVRSPAA